MSFKINSSIICEQNLILDLTNDRYNHFLIPRSRLGENYADTLTSGVCFGDDLTVVVRPA